MFKRVPPAGLVVLALLNPAFAQERPTGWAFVPSGVSATLDKEALKDYCVFNSRIFSQGVEICLRKGIAYHCYGPNTKENTSGVAAWSAVGSTCAGAELQGP